VGPLPLLLVLLAQPPAEPEEAAAPPPPPCEEEEAEEEEDEGPWDASFGLGLSFFAGNTREYTVTSDLLAEYDTERWSLTLEADGGYGRARAEGEAEHALAVAEAGGFVRAERRLTPLFGVFTFVGASTDHMASLQLRTEAELGVALTLIERGEEEKDELFLRLDVGAEYARDRRFQYDPVDLQLEDLNLWSSAVGLTFRYDINERVALREYARVLPNLVGDWRVLVSSTTKLSVGLTDRFALATFFKVKHDSAPAAGKESTDAALTVGAAVVL
jgi:putative salt-induced outer membrane protein YdiY